MSIHILLLLDMPERYTAPLSSGTSAVGCPISPAAARYSGIKNLRNDRGLCRVLQRSCSK